MAMKMTFDWQGEEREWYLFARENGPHRKVDVTEVVTPAVFDEDGDLETPAETITKKVWRVPVRVHISFKEGSGILDMVSDESYECEDDADITYPNIYAFLMGLDRYESAISDEE